MSRHWPSQKSCPLGHSQLPLVHTFPPLHTLPHEPQSSVVFVRVSQPAPPSQSP